MFHDPMTWALGQNLSSLCEDGQDAQPNTYSLTYNQFKRSHFIKSILEKNPFSFLLHAFPKSP